jgi:hypothetical protein
MKWAPTLLVIAAFGVLLYVARSKPPETAGPGTSTGTAAPEAGQGDSTARSGSMTPAINDPEHAARTSPGTGGGATAPETRPEAPKAAEAADAPAPAPIRDGLSGAVVDAGGDGKEQLVVELVGADGSVIATTTSGAGGRFAFERVAAGTYGLRASDPNFVYTASRSAPVTVQAGQAAQARIEVDRGTAAIAGSLVDGQGEPLADASVTIDAGRTTLSILSDGEGRFLVSGLVAGSWRVTPAGRTALARSVDVADGAKALVEFQVVEPAAVEVEFGGSTLHPARFAGGEIAVLRAVDTETARQHATGLSIREGEGEHAHAALAGGFEGVEPGAWELDVLDAAGKRSLLNGGAPFSRAVPLTLREGELRRMPLKPEIAARSSGAEVPGFVKFLMFAVIGLLVLATPIVFPPPIVARKPAGSAR